MLGEDSSSQWLTPPERPFLSMIRALPIFTIDTSLDDDMDNQLNRNRESSSSVAGEDQEVQ
jgi:hypothetical protein